MRLGTAGWGQAGDRSAGARRLRRAAALFAFACLARSHAADVPATIVPTVIRAPLAAGAVGPGPALLASTLSAARDAQEAGLPSLAIPLYQTLLATPGPDRSALTLGLASALLDAGRPVEVEQLLNGLPGPRTAEWRIRMGLALADQKKFDVAAEQVRQISADQLTRSDRAWLYFLQALLADTGPNRDASRADALYEQARNEAPSPLALATFQAGQLRVRMTLVSYTPAVIDETYRQYQLNIERGSRAYGPAETYAIMRAATGGTAEAVRFLQELLVRIPRAERQWTDGFWRLLGMIGDRGRGGAGRHALNQLLENGSTPDFQRQALQLLARDSVNEPERGLFRAELDKLLAGTRKSPVYDSLLLARAELALHDAPKDYATAERLANELKNDFPGSPLRPHAFVVLATSAWEQRRYRAAADNARQAREALRSDAVVAANHDPQAAAQAAGELHVLEAEARFRAEDYAVAADAYGAVLQAPPRGISSGDLIFQRILSTIRAEENDPKADLAKDVDALETDPRLDPANRWEAEWSLARGLRIQGKTQQALDRVTGLLAATGAAGAAITPELRARMSWLQARLSFDANQPQLTLQLVPRLQPLLEGVRPELRTEIASTAALLEAQADFRLDRKDAALEALKRLRTQLPQTEAAISSYLVEAAYYAEPGRDQIQDAQRTLRRLIEDPHYKDSPYVPYALFKMAELSERLGNPRDANDRIEELVKYKTAPSELVFTARLKQGDLLETLNDYASAQRAYEDLVNNPSYAAQPDEVVVAQLRLAECHNAQASTDLSGSHAELAQSLFEELLYRAAAPAAVRIEAGYNLGKMLERRGEFQKAREVWWRDVVDPFLVRAVAGETTGATRGYWLARTLLDLGDMLERRENLDDARRVFVLLRDSKLGYGEDIASDRLARLGAVPATSAAKS